MSYNIVTPPRMVRIPVHVYAHDSLGPVHGDLPDIMFRVLLCQTTTVRYLVQALCTAWNRKRKRRCWQIGKILDKNGDEFECAKDTVWGALGLLPICVMKAPPVSRPDVEPPLITPGGPVDPSLHSSEADEEGEVWFCKDYLPVSPSSDYCDHLWVGVPPGLESQNGEGDDQGEREELLARTSEETRKATPQTAPQSEKDQGSTHRHKDLVILTRSARLQKASPTMASSPSAGTRSAHANAGTGCQTSSSSRHLPSPAPDSRPAGFIHPPTDMTAFMWAGLSVASMNPWYFSTSDLPSLTFPNSTSEGVPEGGQSTAGKAKVDRSLSTATVRSRRRAHIFDLTADNSPSSQSTAEEEWHAKEASTARRRKGMPLTPIEVRGKRRGHPKSNSDDGHAPGSGKASRVPGGKAGPGAKRTRRGKKPEAECGYEGGVEADTEDDIESRLAMAREEAKRQSREANKERVKRGLVPEDRGRKAKRQRSRR
ncbi:hypothetical protein QBC33DRAFT_530529 [Phialemonium atrogriseum]|uniref:Uncharacterized protein n=1 Tax=Phialemonium atrogriseum TaxID=1093897 RepID=A0AAJ0C5C2_9PEZI|nr:uncharacterized protein QBC33DRAFT_530529 [Phialemonium atrogriseum]KAK1770245.1 hypothetical protein QBC33DRAFT_530529 [Phialemonium atrogriseum]